jgi:hypothetical protein
VAGNGTGVGVIEIEIADHYTVGESGEIGGGSLAANQNRGRDGRSYLRCRGSSDLGWRTFGPAERAPHGIQDNLLSPLYHFLRQVAIRQLQRIVAKMIEDAVGHF